MVGECVSRHSLLKVSTRANWLRLAYYLRYLLPYGIKRNGVLGVSSGSSVVAQYVHSAKYATHSHATHSLGQQRCPFRPRLHHPGHTILYCFAAKKKHAKCQDFARFPAGVPRVPAVHTSLYGNATFNAVSYAGERKGKGKKRSERIAGIHFSAQLMLIIQAYLCRGLTEEMPENVPFLHSESSHSLPTQPTDTILALNDSRFVSCTRMCLYPCKSQCAQIDGGQSSPWLPKP